MVGKSRIKKIESAYPEGKRWRDGGWRVLGRNSW